jgi:tetratricopeptide (TPR) repeat protein
LTEANFKYRAFLSYSHADAAVAKRVHARLEGFRINKNDFAGRSGLAAPIPATLRPIFRDRSDFDAGGSLGEQTIAALDASASLIVLCSPHAAKSRYVGEESRLFRARHPDRPVIPLIADGEPGSLESECFPLPLRFAVTPDGAVTDTPSDILAADLREQRDGFDLAIAKVVARLLGLPPDDVYRRAERDRHRQVRLRFVAGTVLVLLLAAVGGFFWRSQQQALTLAEVNALVVKYRPQMDSGAAGPEAQQTLAAAITAIAEGAITDPRYAQALVLLREGKPAAAEPLLKAVAQDKARRAEKDAKDAAAAYRNLAAIAAVSDPKRAREYYAEAARLDPSDLRGMYENGDYQFKADNLDAAEASFNRVIDGGRNVGPEAFWAKIGLGDVQRRRGALGLAFAAYSDAQAFANRGVHSRLSGASEQLSVALREIGETKLAMGDSLGAGKAYEESFGITDFLAKAYPQNNNLLRDRAAVLNGLANARVAQGNLSGALEAFDGSLSDLKLLVESNPASAAWQDNLSQVLGATSDVQATQGDLPGALKSSGEGYAILARLTKADPENKRWAAELAGALDRMGRLSVRTGDLAAALNAFKDSLAAIDGLARADPNNSSLQHDLSLALRSIGDVNAKRGDLMAALNSYQESLAILDRLSKLDPANIGWQRDLSRAHMLVGDMHLAQANLDAALTSYRAEFDVADRVAKADPGNLTLRNQLYIALRKIGDVNAKQRDLGAALKAYQEGLAIVDELSKSDPANAEWRHELAVLDSRLAFIHKAQGSEAAASEELASARTIIAQLVALFPQREDWKRELASLDARLEAPAK